MKNPDRAQAAHLAIREFSIPAGREWVSPATNWSVLHVGKGTGYYLHPHLNQELNTGSVVLISDGVQGVIRASQLGSLAISTFSIMPARLTGLISLAEQELLEMAAARKENALQILPPDSPAAVKMGELLAVKKQAGLPFRLALLQLFVSLVGHELERALPAPQTADAKTRLQLVLRETPAADLLEMNFNELARQVRCTSRHLGRIFQELVGQSFRDKRTEIRLEKARELLARTDAKIVNVALESGFKSLSLFNLMFARHFEMSPGKWRQRQETLGENKAHEKAKKTSAGNLLMLPEQMNSLRLSGQNDDDSFWKKSGLQNVTPASNQDNRRFSAS